MRNFFKSKIKNWQGGMTYTELIVVFSIFGMFSAVVMYNYGAFLKRVEIKSLASDVALKVVQAQRYASLGRLSTYGTFSSGKPSYGVTFNRGIDNKSLVFFADFDASKIYTPGTLTCIPGTTFECVEKISITKGNYVSDTTVFFIGGTSTSYANGVYLTFTRPNREPTVAVTGTGVLSNVSYTQITISSPDGTKTSKVKVYASGRIQIE